MKPAEALIQEAETIVEKAQRLLRLRSEARERGRDPYEAERAAISIARATSLSVIEAADWVLSQMDVSL